METRYRGQKYELPTTGDANDFFGGRSSSNSRRHREVNRAQPLFPRQYSFLIVCGLLLTSFAFVKWIDSRLPTPLSVTDIADNPGRFIEERARNDLIILTQIGPRISGSHANDVFTVDILKRILQGIQIAAKPIHKLEIDVQYPKASFSMGFQEGMTSSYSNIPNVIARLSANNAKSSNNSIVVNCHFDSVPGSPGASDDMLSCTAMLEALRILTASETRLKNPIVFLFNGAEENGLQNSHGFLKGKTKDSSEIGHPWARNLKAFVNLEAAGAGGREILFQTGPGNGWLLDLYSQVPHPFGSALGEEVFQRGLIPSDTDYRIFRDFAKIPGLDLALFKNGYVYHTKFDNVDSVTAGTIQNMGDNLLSLLDSLGNLDFELLGDSYGSQEKIVFFDVFGLAFIYYSERTALLVNVIVALITLILAWRDANGQMSQIIWNVVSTLAAWTGGILGSILIGALLNLINFKMPYFTYPSLVFILYAIPCLICQVLTYSVMLKNNEDACWISSRTTMAFLILVLTFTSRAIFVFTINLSFSVFAWYFSRYLFRDGQRRFLVYLAVGELFPLTFALYLAHTTIITFIPIMGRSGSEVPTNLFVGLLTAIVISLPGATGLVSIFLFFKKLFIKVFGTFWIISLLAILLIVGRIPYTEKTPMRLHLVQVDRTFYNTDLTSVKSTDSGFWFFNLDPNIPSYFTEFAKTVPEVERRTNINVDDCNNLHCGLAYYFPVCHLVKNTHWIPILERFPREMSSRVRMDIISDTWISENIRQISFSFVGPDHQTIVLSPGTDWSMVKWDLTESILSSKVPFKNRPTYFIFYARGIEFERFNFTVDLMRNKKPVDERASALDIVHSNFYLHGEEMRTASLREFESRFPSWTYSLGWSAIANSYSIL